MGIFLYASGDSAPIAGITCKINRYKQSQFAVSSFAYPEYGCPFGLPVAPSTFATTWLQFDQTCPEGSIFSHVFIRRSVNKLNQSETSVMDKIYERFEDIVLTRGVTRKQDFFLIIVPWMLLFD